MSRLAALLLLPLLAAGPVRAEIYQWTDANGRVHFGDSAASAGVKAKPVAPARPASADSAPAAPGDEAARRERVERLLQARETERREAQAREAAEARRREQNQQRCQRMRDDLARMDGRRAYVTGSDGARQYLDEQQRQDYTEKANKLLQEHCQ
jgi:hypothetical protein